MLNSVGHVVVENAKAYVNHLPSEDFISNKKIGQIALISFGLFAWTCSSYHSFYMGGAKAVSFLASQAVQFAVIPVFASYSDERDRLDPMTQSFKDITGYIAALSTLYLLTGTIPVVFGAAVLGNIIYNYSFDRNGTSHQQIRMIGPMISLFK